MTVNQRNAKLGNIDSLKITNDDALFYRARIDSLHSILDSLISHYELLATDYDEFLGYHKPNESMRSDQHALLTYADGLINLMTGFIYADIIVSDASESFYEQQLHQLNFDFNFPPRFRTNNTALLAA